MGTVYSQLSITERRRIERWRHAKVPVDEMARVLKRCRSTIFRELKRNHFSDPCMPSMAGSVPVDSVVWPTIVSLFACR
uniref:helix-turn-helix domain-containing protein n=1 Tax=Parasedimentitalea psychrophila TaxID=2997337 RepID=UPI0022EB4092|nr:helix-turn-helix domain-containing protein [Parasedimentitalea psychrophila]